MRALPPQGAMPAPGHPVPPGAYRNQPRGHRWRVEGAHGTAKTLHGFARAIRRGIENMKIQALLTAVAMNLKKLAAAVQFIWSIIGNRPVAPIPASA
ncbi:hypothetical protein D2T30_01680 [Sinirhodobacter populi]|uniref:Transposase DDE domain-containing protein n=1 Tax=Paenirhodobacter populi TaxID=2306993 RepID=A0A443JVV4_9RHOB|nr:hypothetical protein D2T30_01680 [Sinirhodobacter populi]